MNEQDKCESKEQTPLLADLALSPEHEEGTTAGGRVNPFPGFNGTVFVGSADVN